jgi:hypothetical protein
MNVTINQLLVAVLILLLAGCSTKGGTENALYSAEQTRKGKPAALEICKPDVGTPHYYHKTILVAATSAVNDVARDLPGLSILTSQRLQTHLDELDRFKVFAMHQTGFASMDTHTAEHVRQIGRQYAPQFVVKLEILDLTVHSPKGWLSEMFESKQRDVLLKLLIYDAENGDLFYSQQYQGTVSGDVTGYPGNGIRVSTSWFNTDLGMKIDEMLKAMSKQVNEQLACVPFATEVTAVIGDDIHIGSGILHGIRPGTNLQLYHRIEVLGSNGSLKHDKRGGRIRVKKVFPRHSIASLVKEEKAGHATSVMVKVGDVVRAW